MRSIPLKEELTVEFKSDVKKYPDADLVDEIVGMANTKGGALYLGVEDDGKITGVHNAHRDVVGLSAFIANHTVPSIPVRADIIAEGGKDVLKIEIPKSRIVASASSGKMLKRRLKADGAPEVVPMFSYEITSRLSELALLDFSSRPLAGAVVEDFDPNQRVRLRNIIQATPGGEKNLLGLSDDELDKALRFTAEVDGKVYPTATGMLLLGKESRISELMPTAKASFQVLKGTKVSVNFESAAPLLEVFEKFETYFEAWNPEQETEYGLFRVAVPEFDRGAFREGLINAFCHRDYTILGAVRVLIDDEGLTISSPGGFIDGVTLDNLLTAEPHGKNPALADALKRIGLAEKTGRGVDRIYEGSIVYGRPWPDYSETTSANVSLFIRRAKADEQFAGFIADARKRLGRPLSIYALMILSSLRNEKRLAFKRIAESTRLSESKLEGAIESLVEDGLIEGFGSGKSRTFLLSYKARRDNNRNVRRAAKSNSGEPTLSELVLEFAGFKNGVVTKIDVAEALGITPEEAYSAIRKLVAEGKLFKECGGRYARYKLN